MIPTSNGGSPTSTNPSTIDLTFEVNGMQRRVTVDVRMSLLDALRDALGLTGTKKGCDQGACGACTVHVDGKRVLACLTIAAQVDRRSVTTIECFGPDCRHPLQDAFVRNDALQCGFCTPGQIMSAICLIKEGRTNSAADIREFMSGNICRCGAYPNIVAAIADVAAETVVEAEHR